MGRNLKMPWSMEDTIENMDNIRDMLINQARKANLDKKGEEDVKEINFEFGRVKEALKKQISNSHPCASDDDNIRCGNCVNDIEMDDGYGYCPYCGQKL
ncbi:hypothetical protein [[Clostridium] symbiosum]|uniref:hypothetical protein n=1 Tax=Clostridium symbiosum TaxID=1512 RepID=UPI00319DB1BE